MSETLAIHTQGMTRRFHDVVAVNRLDLRIPKATIYGFLGPNGCGKSTSIRMLTGLLAPDDGNISVLGYSLPAQAEQLRPRVGYMTQNFSLYKNLTVYENLDFVGNIYNVASQARKQRIQELLKTYHLDSQRQQMAEGLSGGQKQRLALAAAVFHRPELLFLDEPTSAVDPENRREFWEHLFDLCHDGTTILVSTHYMDEAERCHALAILENGVKRADGPPQQLMQEIGASVIELAGHDLSAYKKRLIALPEVVSAAQIGARLRVLVKKDITEPLTWLQHTLSGCEMEIVRPSLEDVFVVATGGRHAG